MKFFVPVILLTLLACVAASWAPEDYEIFSLNDKVRDDLGPEVTFYSWLSLPKGPKSTADEINRAYRKLSRTLHPDKFNKGSKSARKAAEERFQRLSVVGNILKTHDLKTRYDYFLKNGFPKWKGTGYLYSRFKPGFGFTLLVIYIFIGAFQYVSLKISRKQDYKRLAALKQDVIARAWNNSIIPPLDGSSRRIGLGTNEFHVSPVGEVSLVQKEGSEEYLEPVDENDINVNPSFKESLFFKIPCFMWNKSLGRLTGWTINTAVVYRNPKNEIQEMPHDSDLAPKKKNQRKGAKLELPNGKVMYSRKKGSK